MNLILFEPHEIDRPLPRTDRRAGHILAVLRRSVGESFDVALLNGPRGKATLAAQTPETLTLAFAWETAPAVTPLDAPGSLTLLVGLPRPQTARDILRDATTLGVEAIHFVRTDKAERSYAQSTLWSSGEWRRHLIAGAEQAFDPRIPMVTHDRPLSDVLAALPATTASTRLALDNYEAPAALGACAVARAHPLVLAIGAERGWSAAERARFREHGFIFAHLGARVLRTETAVVAALALVRAKLGLM